MTLGKNKNAFELQIPNKAHFPPTYLMKIKILLFLDLNRGRKPVHCSLSYIAEMFFCNRTVYVPHSWHLLQLLLRENTKVELISTLAPGTVSTELLLN